MSTYAGVRLAIHPWRACVYNNTRSNNNIDNNSYSNHINNNSSNTNTHNNTTNNDNHAMLYHVSSTLFTLRTCRNVGPNNVVCTIRFRTHEVLVIFRPESSSSR